MKNINEIDIKNLKHYFDGIANLSYSGSVNLDENSFTTEQIDSYIKLRIRMNIETIERNLSSIKKELGI